MSQQHLLPFTAPVVRVTVLEDRAQVLRRGSASLPKGRARARLPGVAPVLVDKTLVASLPDAPPGTRVTDLRVERSLLPVEQQVQRAAAATRLAEVQAERNALLYRAQANQRQLELIGEMSAATVADMTVDAAWDRARPEAWRAASSDLFARERALRERSLELAERIADLDVTVADLAAAVAAERRPELQMLATVVVDLEVTEAGDVTLELGYVVPAACWRPQHTARLLPDGAAFALLLETDACVWQRTGEDWVDVELRLSTQRLSLGFEPPLLGEEVLESREKPPEVAVEVRDLTIRTTGLGAGARAATDLPGIDDGGAALFLQARRPATVPSDGCPTRVPVADFTVPVELERVLLAERTTAVVARVRGANPGPHPILAGPVDLVTGGGLVGRGALRFVAAGERFEVGFGPDANIRVRRTVERVEEEPGKLSTWIPTRVTVTLQLSNIGAGAVAFTVTERVPVSEIPEVRVAVDSKATTAGATPDGDGFFRWPLTLSAGATTTLRLAFVLERKKEIAALAI
jgi:uncharacterized protein (TIGR02231 family)